MRTAKGRAQAALTLGCPRCQARAGQPCMDLRMLGTGRRIANLAPHPERIKLAEGDWARVSDAQSRERSH